MKKFLVIFLIVLILFNSLFIPDVSAVSSFASLFGGGNNGVEALALLTVLAGLGVTAVTADDAVALYENFKGYSQATMTLMSDIVSQSWLGGYSGIVNQIVSIKETVYDWLVDLFGDVEVGVNSAGSPAICELGYGYYEYTHNIKDVSNQPKPWNDWSNGYREVLTTFIYFGHIYELVYCAMRVSENSFIHRVDCNGLTNSFASNFFSQYNCELGTRTQGLTLSYPYKIGIFTVPHDGVIEGPIEAVSDISANISSDAGVLEGEYDPEDKEPIILPPPYLGDWGTKEKVNPDGTKQRYYDGDIEGYTKDITNNKSYSDIDNFLKTGSNSTTLLDAGDGTLNVGDVVTDGIPYPDVNTGETTGLLQGITNWIANLVNIMSNIFAIPNDLTLNFDSLRLTDFKNKFPFSIPWDIAATVSVFSKTPSEPDLTIDIDTKYLQLYHTIDISRIDLPIRFARYAAVVFFVFFLANKTRDLIKW